MKISGIIGLIILVTGIFLAGGLLIDDFETSYVDTGISPASPINQNLTDDLVTQDELNETFDPIQEKVEDLQTQEGFLDVLGDGVVVLPTLFINFVTTILTFIGLSQKQTITILNFLGIPIILILFVTVGIAIWFIFKIIEQLRRYPT